MGRQKGAVGHFYTFPDDIRRAMDDPKNGRIHWLRSGVVYCSLTRESFIADGNRPPKKCRYCKAALRVDKNLVIEEVSDR